MLLTLLCAFFLNQPVVAAPHPSAALLSNIQEGLFWRARGYTFQIAEGNWLMDKKESKDVFILKRAQNPLFEININEDHLSAPISMESYTRRWIKDYVHLGFQISSSKPFKQAGQPGLLLDLWHTENKKRIRQAVFLKSKKAVIVTCSGNEKTFATDVNDCSLLIKTFRWIQ